MKVLVVDDDRNIVENIVESIAWKELGIEQILTAYDGIWAREVMEKQKPEIVLCDIEMPLATGLDLLRWVKSQKYSCKFIFLTCFDSFDFAREALILGANDYILKPLHPARITGALLKAVKEIRAADSRREEYQRLMDKAHHNLVRNFFRELMERSIPAKEETIVVELANRGIVLDLKESFWPVLACIQAREIMEQGWEESSFYFAFRQLFIEAVLEKLEHPYVVDWENGGFYYCLLITGKSSIALERLQEQCRLFVDICGQYLQSVPSCYIGLPVYLHEFADSIHELRRLANEAGLQRGKVRLLGEIQELEGFELKGIDGRRIIQCLEGKDKISLNRYLRNMLQNLREEDKLTAHMMHSVYEDLMQNFYGWLLNHEVEAHRLFMEKGARQLYENAEKSVIDLIKWIDFLFDASMEQIEKMKQFSTMVQKAKEYIRLHYKENIGRDEIASSIFVTPNYLSKIFKEETGIMLNEYINQVRIDAAKEILRKTDQSVAYVAMESGFENISYFSTVFKRVCGMTPKEYRAGNR